MLLSTKFWPKGPPKAKFAAKLRKLSKICVNVNNNIKQRIIRHLNQSSNPKMIQRANSMISSPQKKLDLLDSRQKQMCPLNQLCCHLPLQEADYFLNTQEFFGYRIAESQGFWYSPSKWKSKWFNSCLVWQVWELLVLLQSVVAWSPCVSASSLHWLDPTKLRLVYPPRRFHHQPLSSLGCLD